MLEAKLFISQGSHVFDLHSANHLQRGESEDEMGRVGGKRRMMGEKKSCVLEGAP